MENLLVPGASPITPPAKPIRGRPPETMTPLQIAQIKEALKATNGGRYAAAKLLGIGITTLYNKLKKMKVPNKINATHSRKKKW